MQESKNPPRRGIYWVTYLHKASQVVLVVKNLPASAREERDSGSIPTLGRSAGVKNGKPL